MEWTVVYTIFNYAILSFRSFAEINQLFLVRYSDRDCMTTNKSSFGEMCLTALFCILEHSLNSSEMRSNRLVSSRSVDQLP